MAALPSEIIVGGAVTLALSGGLIAANAARSGRARRIRQQIVRITDGSPDTGPSGWFGVIVLAFGRRALRRTREFEDLSTLLQSAGYFSPLMPYRVVALQLVLAFMCALVAAGLAAAMDVESGSLPLAIVAGVAMGYLAPRIALRVLAASRRRRVRRELPFFIDTLLLLLRGGLGLERCLREIAQLGGAAMPDIARSVELAIVDIEQGRTYDEALERWAGRMASPAADEIARQLQQSMNHGTELSKALSLFAQRLIAQQLASARERAGRRTTHVTVVTMLFFMPPLLVVLATPAFTQVIRLLGHH